MAPRRAVIERETKETRIRVELGVDGSGRRGVATEGSGQSRTLG